MDANHYAGVTPSLYVMLFNVLLVEIGIILPEDSEHHCNTEYPESQTYNIVYLSAKDSAISEKISPSHCVPIPSTNNPSSSVWDVVT